MVSDTGNLPVVVMLARMSQFYTTPGLVNNVSQSGHEIGVAIVSWAHLYRCRINFNLWRFAKLSFESPHKEIDVAKKDCPVA